MSKIKIHVSEHDHGHRVHVREAVVGGTCCCTENLQVFVFSGDDRWYPQAPPIVDALGWFTAAQFGFEPPRTLSGHYKVAAVALDQPPVWVPVSSLPAGVQSNVVTVHRVPAV